MKQVRPVGAAELAEKRGPETAYSEKECDGKVKVRLCEEGLGPMWRSPFLEFSCPKA
jgi:hypothetical protein